MIAAVVAGPSAAGAASVPGPVPVGDGWVVAATAKLGAGLDRVSLAGARQPQRVEVARLDAKSPFALRAVLSNGSIAPAGPRLESTSSMCARQQCIVGINADFAALGTSEPVGGVVVAGELIRSPNPLHHQINIAADGTLSMGKLDWTSRFVSTDLKEFSVDGVNVERRADQLVLYTPRYGPTTGANRHGIEVVAEIVEPSGPLRLDQTHVLRVVKVRRNKPGATLHAGQVVLSGHGKGARVLRGLADRIKADEAGPTLLTRLSAGGVVQSVGGTPVLVRKGAVYVGNDGSNFRAGRHPRTMIGWTADGDTLLVTVDGRQPGRALGMSLSEAAQLMVSLGAVEALNLDGGGSTTFVTSDGVANRPSDTLVARGGRRQMVAVPRPGDLVVGAVERAVVSALVIVPDKRAVIPAGRAPRPQAVQVPLPGAEAVRSVDPGSSPAPLPALPALVWEAAQPLTSPPPVDRTLVTAAAVALTIAAAGSGALLRGRLEPALADRRRR